MKQKTLLQSSNAKTFTLGSFLNGENSASERPGSEGHLTKGRRNHASVSTCYVSCSHRSYDEPWLLDITSTSVAIIGLCSRTECPSRREDLAEPPHDRSVHRRSRLQVRVVL